MIHRFRCSKLFRIKLFRNYCNGKSETQENTNFEKIVFSGIQPTGVLHMGNYYGAVENWLHVQEDKKFSKIYISVVDMHAVTMYKPPEELKLNIMQMTASLLACGIDPERVVLFQQSSVPHHALLAWLLSTFATLPQLASIPNFKEKSAQFSQGEAPLALFSYPVLQAADILLYKGSHVPVGDDQAAHMNFARKLADLFNMKYQLDYFPLPKTLKSKFNRLKSLRDPTKKMSKSDPDTRACVFLTDSPDIIRNKFKKSLTDLDSKLTYDLQERPAVSNLITIHSAICGKTPAEIVEEFGERFNTGKYKLFLADCVNEKFGPIRERYLQYVKDPDYLHKILDKGNEKAAAVAESHIKEVKTIIGMTF